MRALIRATPFLLIGLLLHPAGSNAEGPEGETFTPGSHLPKAEFQAQVDSRPDGVYVQISGRETVSGDSPTHPPSPPESQAPAAPVPERTWVDLYGYHHQTSDGTTQDLTPAHMADNAFWQSQFAAHPGAYPYVLTVNGQDQGLFWMPDLPTNPQFGPPPPVETGPAGDGGSHDPYQVARYLETHIPLPTAQIEANPGVGLVGLPSWFWVQGYTGQPFGASQTVTIPPAIPGGQPTSFTVSVRIWGDKYQWNFGDGGPAIDGTLGKPYPQESDMRHLYQFSSLTQPSGFPVQLTVEFAAQYQVNGGAPQGLPPIEHTYRTNLPVQQAQTTLSAPQRP